MTQHLYKIWTVDRQKKTSLLLPESDNMLSDLIAKSNTKLGIAGSVIVMEKDGTVIDDDNVLKFCSGKTLMLLQPKESWLAGQNITEIHTPQSADTISITSENKDAFSSQSSSTRSFSPSIFKMSSKRKESLNYEAWQNFVIPWNKLESSVIKELESGSRNKYIINAVVNCTVSEMRNVQDCIPYKVFKMIEL